MSLEKPKFKKGYFEKKAKNYNIIGKGLTSERKTDLAAYLEGIKDRSAEPIEGEYLKTKEQLGFIEYINKHLNDEFEELKINRKTEILPEQIHLLPKDVYRRVSEDYSSPGHFSPLSQEARLNRDNYLTRLRLFKGIFHEIIHMASFLRYQERKKELRPLSSKTGYSGRFGSENERYEIFDGLNEMVVDKLIPEINKKHRKEFVEKFKLTEWEQKESINFYHTDIIDTIIEKIAAKNKENKEDVWKRFEKGLFTGEMMHLRDVEKTFGKNSLRLLAAFNFKDEIIEKNHNTILECFQINDDKEREKMINELLPELEKYKIEPADEGKIPQKQI